MARREYIRGLFAKFGQKDMHCPAFKALSPISRYAIFELDLRYWESGQTNPIEIPQRWLAEILDCDPKTAGKVITALDDHGFLEMERKGDLRGPVRARAAVYRLTWHPDNGGQPATFDFRRRFPELPKNHAGNSPACRKEKLVLSVGKNSGRRGKKGAVGETAAQILERLKAQRNGENGTGLAQ